MPHMLQGVFLEMLLDNFNVTQIQTVVMSNLTVDNSRSLKKSFTSLRISAMTSVIITHVSVVASFVLLQVSADPEKTSGNFKLNLIFNRAGEDLYNFVPL